MLLGRIFRPKLEFYRGPARRSLKKLHQKILAGISKTAYARFLQCPDLIYIRRIRCLHAGFIPKHSHPTRAVCWNILRKFKEMFTH